ncbi:uncharacterized protein LOC121381422 isoform X2 [Gigantopelta aegis]|uniref:uncharacterized protein LOC121381422 isoform X2 n=1 Tax=Gigantopelta aegis TaxID=1735272 RepID=UPI001B889B2B|nr:uncharacterized protein LOC121381422 isoform X2 [Gigantopelta aegis]
MSAIISATSWKLYDESFHNLSGIDGRYMYSWNPCNSFSDGDGCTNVAACQTDLDGHQYSLGTQDTSHFITDRRLGLLITYHAVTDAHRRLFVRLECNHSVEHVLHVQGETAPGSAKYFINLISKYACPIPGGVVPTTTRMTSGEILVIVLAVVVVLCITLGLCFQLVVWKASGRKMFPDYCLWVNIPDMVKNFHASYRVARDTDTDAATLVYHIDTESSS